MQETQKNKILLKYEFYHPLCVKEAREECKKTSDFQKME